MTQSAVIVIPARMGSSRFPGKPLAKILGVSMLERVWRIAKASKEANDVVIATDHPELKAHAESFGAKVVMTSENCQTGSDRVAEALSTLGQNYDLVFNLQGDAVLTPQWVIDDILKVMRQEPDAGIATPAVRLKDEALKTFYDNKKAGVTTGTSVVFDKNHHALYFSKAFLPNPRKGFSPALQVFQHIGLYGYQVETLKIYQHLPESALEQAEQLEQLRALENGIAIRVVEVDYQGRTHGSVDRPEDIASVETIIRAEGELVL